MEPEQLVQAGASLVGLGRWLQRTFPPVGRRGSQCEEDEIVAKLLAGDGMYVDVGAAHPCECSNTWQLYNRGWRGLLIEPLPERWHALLRQRPGDFLCPCAASDVDGFARMRVCRDVSSFRPDWPIEEQGQLLVETERLASILGRYPSLQGKCRFMSIDVEGHERQVLDGIDWATFKPEVICIEYRKFDPAQLGHDESGLWDHVLKGQGYTLHAETALNRIYVRT